MRSVLIYPPTTDPTSGYHSLCYIDSYARAQGLPASDIIDANIEAFHYSFTDAALARFTDELAGPQRAADLRHYLDNGSITAQAHLLRVGEPDQAGIRRAVDTLRDPATFYDLDHYRHAVDTVNAWMNYLGSVGFPGQFRNGFEPTQVPVNVRSIRSVTDHRALRRINAPFQPYYDDVLLPRLANGGYDVVGVNVTFEWQLPFALWIMKLVRDRLPNTFLVAGGTEVSDTWKYATDKASAFGVFADCDAIVVGEGETAYVEILRSVATGDLPSGHPNIRLHPKLGVGRALPVFRYESLADLPTPDYSQLPWDLYLSPERFVYYSPTRGCYWNKCTFCDYGLNGDSPTSPWRQEPVDRMMRDVTELAKFTKFIYFSVDVLAPATILRFAERVIEEGLNIRWGAEIRLEKYWSPERCQILRRSGCTAVAVGFESGCQRIIDLIDKGTTPERVRQTISAMSGAGIGVQMMAFTGFPTETVAEAKETLNFLSDTRDLWTFGGAGEFILTAGSIVARQPERFGISNVAPLRSEDDIVRKLRYDDPTEHRSHSDPDVAAAREQLAGQYLGRPWAGCTEVAHTYFYHDRYGTAARDVVLSRMAVNPGDEDRHFLINGALIDRPDDAVIAEFLRLFGRPGRALPDGTLLFRRADGNITPVPGHLDQVLRMFHTPMTLTQARDRLWMFDDTTVDNLFSTLLGVQFLRRLPQLADRAPESRLVPAVALT